MTPQSQSHPPNQTARKHKYPALLEAIYRIGSLMFFAGLFFLFYLLAHSMVQHRFFRGGEYHQNGSVGQ